MTYISRLAAAALAIATTTNSANAKDNAIYKTLDAPREDMGYREIPPLAKRVKMLYLNLKPNGKIMGLITGTNLWLEYKVKGVWSGFMSDLQISEKDWG